MRAGCFPQEQSQPQDTEGLDYDRLYRHRVLYGNFPGEGSGTERNMNASHMVMAPRAPPFHCVTRKDKIVGKLGDLFPASISQLLLDILAPFKYSNRQLLTRLLAFPWK